MTRDDFGKDNRWLLPEGVDEVLPPRAAQLEQLRRRLLDMYAGWGYELVLPPLIEYLDSLLTGTGHDLDLQTFKLTDQLSGRMMGVRADITPQAARIDAHQLKREAPTRLCYIGSVLQTRLQGLSRSRNPVQIGAELYGHAGVESDVEIIGLMLETLRTAGIEQPYLDLGHVGIFRGLTAEAGLDAAAEGRLFEALQRKATPEIEDLFREFGVRGPAAEALLSLAELNGGIEILDEAGERLRGTGEAVQAALQDLWGIAAALERRLQGVPLHFDLAELRGYRYHTGPVFAAFVAGHGQDIARGGRYDHIGGVFGRSRPATGFSADLKTLADLAGLAPVEQGGGIFVDWADEPALLARVAQLRAEGERVVWGLPGQRGGAAEAGCERRLVERDGDWQIENL